MGRVSTTRTALRDDIMSEIAFTSALGSEHKDELERLLFFNTNQAKVTRTVTLVAERYGVPKILIADDRLRIELESGQAQTLFAVRGTGHREAPVGVLIYTREEDALLVLFLAVHEDYSSRGPNADQRLLMRMTNELKGIARRVRGVSSVVLFMGRPTPTRISVSHGPKR